MKDRYRQDPAPQSVADLGEFALIRRIRRIIEEHLEGLETGPVTEPSRSSAEEEILLGPGDDAAVLRPEPGWDQVLTCDVQVAGRHFRPEWMEPRQIGRRAMAVNLSDLAAMGAAPRHALISLGLPGDMPAIEVEEIYRGLLDLLHPAGGRIIGGNLSASGAEWFCDVTLIGRVAGGLAMTRAGAKAGDRILVTGSPGRSAAGLALLARLQEGLPSDREAFREALRRFLFDQPWAVPLVGAYLEPTPRLPAGALLREMMERGARITSLIDLSDGLTGDLERVCEESRVCAVLRPEQFPVDPELERATAFLGSGGWPLLPSDDYELLFTVGPDHAPLVSDELHRACSLEAIEVGEILPPDPSSQGPVRIAGPPPEAAGRGWDHFRKR